MLWRRRSSPGREYRVLTLGVLSDARGDGRSGLGPREPVALSVITSQALKDLAVKGVAVLGGPSAISSQTSSAPDLIR